MFAPSPTTVDLSDARIDHFSGAFVSQADGGVAGGNSLHATFRDVSHCGAGTPGLFFHFFDGNASLTVDRQPQPVGEFDLPPCSS